MSTPPLLQRPGVRAAYARRLSSIRTVLAGGVAGLFLALLPTAHADRAVLPQYAPPDAYLPGDPLPYYGSENPWDRRFFVSEKPPRVGQPQMLLIHEGRIDDAIALCRARIAEEGTEVESHFLLAIALGLKGAATEAERSLQTALDLGLPPERVLAGPRTLMTGLRPTKPYRQIETASAGLVHGPLLGAVTPSSARFWMRTLRVSTVEVRASRRGDFTRPDSKASARTRAGADFTTTLELSGLEPSTTYHYGVWIDGAAVPRAGEWSFHTFPDPQSRDTVRIAFGGCARYWPPYERMWDTIRLRQPDAFLLLGDNVYLDLPETVGAFHDYTYYQRQSRPEFRRLVASTPIYAIWDDHDAGIDDVFLGPYPDKPAWKPQHLELFRRNWNNPSYGAPPERPGVWFSFRVGAAEFFMLDGRYYRENFLKPNPSMLGPVQKKWLLDGLARSTATFKLLVSPVAWADDAKIESDPNGNRILAKDIWTGFTGEREEIYNFLADQKISGVVLLSGDRHRADFRVNQRPRGYPLPELMCSWLTNSVGASLSGKPLWAYNAGPSFAVLTFDASSADPTIGMQVSTIEGVPVFERTISLSELRDH